MTQSESEKFENLTKKIAKEISKSAKNLGDARITQGSKNKIEGKSGYKHQIDVSITTNGQLALIECKKYKDKVSLRDMLTLIARVDDIKKKYSKFKVIGVFFTTQGYTRNALTLANAYKIECNIAKTIKNFAIHIAGNVLIRPRSLNMKLKLQKQKVVTTQCIGPTDSDR